MTCVFTLRQSDSLSDGCDILTSTFPGTPELRIASKKIDVRVSLDCLIALSCALAFICPFGACVCNSAVHATNFAFIVDMAVLATVHVLIRSFKL